MMPVNYKDPFYSKDKMKGESNSMESNIEKTSKEILPVEIRRKYEKDAFEWIEAPLTYLYHQALEKAEADLEEKSQDYSRLYKNMIKINEELKGKYQEVEELKLELERRDKKNMQDIKDYAKSLDTPDNEVYKRNELIILSCFSKAMEIIENNQNRNNID